MSASIQPIATQEAATQTITGGTSLLSKYAELMKLRVTTLVVATAWCGYFMVAVKSGVPSFSWTLLYTLLVIPIWGISSVTAVLSVYSAEIYPTRIRSQGTGLAAGASKAGGVMIGPLGVCFVADVASNDDLHLLLTTLPSFRFAAWEVMPLIPFHRDIEMSLDDALGRAHARDGADA